MKMKSNLHIYALAVILLAVPVFAQSPQLPHLFYGNADADSTGLPAGSVIIAKANGTEIGRITTTEAGKYGGPSASDGKLLVQGNIEEGAAVEFFVNRIKANEVAQFRSGSIENKNLTWTFPESVNVSFKDKIVNEPIVVKPDAPILITATGLEIKISSGSAVSGTIENITKLESNFFAGAFAVPSGQNALNAFEIKITGSVTITVTMSYSDTGIDEGAIVPYKFDGTKWVALPSSSIVNRNTAANTITFTISAETPYAIFGSAPAPAPSATGGGGGAAGGCTPNYKLSSPESVTGTAGSAVTVPVNLTATGTCGGTAAITTSVPAGWATTNNSVLVLAGQSKTVDIVITIPSDAVTSVVRFAASIAGNPTSTTTVNIAAQATTTTTVPSPTPVQNITTPAEQPPPVTGEVTPPLGITGLITANPAAAGGIVIAVLAVIYVGWRFMRKGGGKKRAK